ncbi:similar to Saccharomyces cerevisiae YPL083C SEN54 Subunit of the tRNA splicing endonuclease, which is composed of Sen2p, Sen15p, Sen34p, and Sen54p [Maudiozyma saulgeensis]|uniref:Similar to Saccharomyces cerevisiae YPL083C SEN54 Subunit of the tRNA splicing endonuclease, which is composed of Sen2p, Sen15p, Sen34p, and Sen54p n=1 Tax=Maudiozyma saulgeensis TaxID=1789683 RepID=A0A1X7R1R8_9SACH|nr:similar to Saccharomyces cerevisiae YPL083C SEN54 Subunit of the tRNA splicing endonuclease, which is composed of Sen2p, Sen15p, Sen34p, and Sen54p [Kazachstania saulgeensis]
MSTATNQDTDLNLDEDEVIQDWSDISKIQNDNPILSIPKRGEKDYEPDGTDIQELLLYRAKKAMFDTLENSVRGSTSKSQVKGYYIPDKHIAMVPYAKGNFVQSMGETDKDGTLWLHFFEFLYLAERGTITPFWKAYGNNVELPLSIEDLYSYFKTQKEMDNFSIYAHLKRLGFIVRSSDQYIITKNNTSFYPPMNFKSYTIGSMRNIINRISSTFTYTGISLFNGIIFSQWHFYLRRYRSSPDIYESLNKLISYHKIPHSITDLRHEYSSLKRSTSNSTPTSLHITFNIWKPNPTFKKKYPELPDYQVVTYNKNMTNQSFPTFNELEALFRSLDYKFNFIEHSSNTDFWNKNTYNNGVLREDILNDLTNNARNKNKQPKIVTKKPTENKNKKPGKELPPHIQQLKRLKNGYRSFLLAIMDNGIVSFAKISEADFGSENVWYVPPPKGTIGRPNKNWRKTNKSKDNHRKEKEQSEIK